MALGLIPPDKDLQGKESQGDLEPEPLAVFQTQR